MKNIARWGLVALGLMTVPAWAEDLVTAYNQALQNDPTFKAAEAGYQATRELAPLSRALLLPTITGSANTGRSHINQTNGDNNASFNQNAQQYSLNLKQTLFDYRAWAGLKNANAQVKQGYANYNAAVQDLIVRVTSAYLAVLQAHDQWVATAAQKRSLKEQLKQTQEQFNVGLIAITGVQQVKANYDATVALEIANQNAIADKLEELRAITNVFPTALMGVQRSLPLIAPAPQDINAWVETAVKQSYALQASYYQMIAARENVKVQRGGHFPTVSATGSYSYSNQDLGVNGSSANGTNLAPSNNRTASVGVGVQLPVFEGGSVNAQTRQAAAEYAQASAQMEQTYRSTLTQTREAYLGVISGISKLKADQQAIISSQSSLDSTKAGYQAGANTIVDVLQQQTNLFNAQNSLAVDQYTYLTSVINLKQAAGTLSTSDIEMLNSWLTKPLDFSTYDFNTHALSYADSSSAPVSADHKPAKKAVKKQTAKPAAPKIKSSVTATAVVPDNQAPATSKVTTPANTTATVSTQTVTTTQQAVTPVPQAVTPVSPAPAQVTSPAATTLAPASSVPTTAATQPAIPPSPTSAAAAATSAKKETATTLLI